MNIIPQLSQQTYLITIAVLVSISILSTILIILVNKNIQKTCKKVQTDLKEITQKRDEIIQARYDMRQIVNEDEQRIKDNRDII